MYKISSKQQKIIQIFLRIGESQSSGVHKEIRGIGEDVSLVTIKRALSEMVEKDLLKSIGSGRSTKYVLSSKGRIFADLDMDEYTSIEPDKRYGQNKYNFELLKDFPTDLFIDNELEELENSTKEYKKITKNLSPTIQKKELERLIIELSWKSSKIEGNTYTLLDTEKLIRENKKALGHTNSEAQMILNHKDAFNYIRKNSSQFKTITRKNLEELHAILVKDLKINLGFRKKLVGITGSSYRPLDNVYQITEAVKQLSKIVSSMKSPYAKALTALLGISYIQPFEDGNKRTSRLMTNALLISHKLTPLSYRSVDENNYRNAMLIFYELNSITPMKKIFIEQYKFATHNYALK